MNLIIPWKNNPATEAEAAAFNLVNVINFSVQRINEELASIYEQLNRHKYLTAAEITAAMGDSSTVFLAYQSATQSYVDALATAFNVAPSTIASGPNFLERLNVLTTGGYTDPDTGIHIQGDDRAMKERWAPQTVSILNLLALGTPGTTELTTVDYDDQPITLTFTEFQHLMARYSAWFSAKFLTALTP